MAKELIMGQLHKSQCKCMTYLPVQAVKLGFATKPRGQLNGSVF